MAGSLRDQLLDAISSALSGAALGGFSEPTGLTVIEDRTHPIEEDQLPQICFYPEDEAPEPLDKLKFKAPFVRKELVITLEYRAQVGSQVPRKAIDPLYLWTMQQLGADETFGTLAMGIVEGPTKWLSKESDALVAAAAQRFTIYYRTSRLNPSTTS